MSNQEDKNSIPEIERHISFLREIEEVHEPGFLEGFELACKPLMKWLSENCHPHSYCIVNSTRAELIEGVICFKTEEFLTD